MHDAAWGEDALAGMRALREEDDLQLTQPDVLSTFSVLRHVHVRLPSVLFA